MDNIEYQNYFDYCNQSIGVNLISNFTNFSDISDSVSNETDNSIESSSTIYYEYIVLAVVTLFYIIMDQIDVETGNKSDSSNRSSPTENLCCLTCCDRSNPIFIFVCFIAFLIALPFLLILMLLAFLYKQICRINIKV